MCSRYYFYIKYISVFKSSIYLPNEYVALEHKNNLKYEQQVTHHHCTETPRS